MEQPTITYSDSERRRTLLAVFVGYMFDGYDLQLISYLLQPMSVSLSTSVPALALAVTYSLIGSVIGGFFFGWLADIVGRKRTLLLTIATFGVFTFATGFVTNITEVYLLRFLAGLGIGGEWGIGFSMLNEAWTEKTRGVTGSVLASMYPYGLLLAAVTTGTLLGEFGGALGWRYSFMVAGLLSLGLLSLRFLLPESKMWSAYIQAKRAKTLPQGYDTRAPVSQIFSRTFRAKTVLISLLSIFALFGGYSMIVFVPSYLGAKGLHIPVSDYTIMISLALFLGTPGYWVDGYLADKLGRRKASWIFITGLLLTLVSFFYEVLIHPVYTDLLHFPLFYILILFNFFQGYFGHLGVWFGELFPTKIRATASNFAFVVAGRGVGAGLAPILIPMLALQVGSYGLAMTAGGIIGAAVALLFTLLITETKGTVVTPL